jgi:hypothetical protein
MLGQSINGHLITHSDCYLFGKIKGALIRQEIPVDIHFLTQWLKFWMEFRQTNCVVFSQLYWTCWKCNYCRDVLCILVNNLYAIIWCELQCFVASLITYWTLYTGYWCRTSCRRDTDIPLEPQQFFSRGHSHSELIGWIKRNKDQEHQSRSVKTNWMTIPNPSKRYKM